MHRPTDRITHTTAFVTPVVECILLMHVCIYEYSMYVCYVCNVFIYVLFMYVCMLFYMYLHDLLFSSLRRCNLIEIITENDIYLFR